MSTLIALAAEHRALAARLADLDLDPQTIADTLEAEAGALEVKGQAVALVARDLDAQADAIKTQVIDAATDRMKALRNRAEGLRRYLLNGMQFAGIERIEGPAISIKRAKNPAAVDLFQPELVPAEFMRQPEPPPAAPDKKAIGEALKAGRDVPGARLVQGERLAIK